LLETEAHTEQARQAYERALDVMRATGDRVGEGNVLICLAQTWRRDRRFDEALAIYEAASMIFQEVDDPIGRFMAIESVARVHMMTGDLTLAKQEAKAALAIAEHSSHPRGVQNALITAGEIAHRVGDFRHAVDLLTQALQIARRLDGKVDTAHISFQLAQALQSAGEPQQALVLGRQACDIYTTLGRSEAAKVAAWLATAEP
jgi:tetratricopeptide (TPR) repeat protein